VPSWIFETDSIPTSRTGKTDRRSLATLSDGLVHGRRSAATATRADDVERGLADIWAAVLDVGDIARDRSLLEYGAHSLNIVSALAEIQQRYGTAIAVPDFFQSPTIATLAEMVRAGAGVRR
jgi:acyl carrier protein